MLIRRRAIGLLALTLALGLAAGVSFGTECGFLQGSSSVPLPLYTGTLPGSGDMSLGGGTGYLYILTQWGMARASLADPANPGSISQFVIGKEGGSGNGGIIPILCDCHQGSNNMDVVESSGGTARLVSDWQPFKQGHGDSGLAAQMTITSGGGNVAFGNQIDLGSDVPVGARSAAVYLPSSGKYFGYFPTSGDNVQKVDLTNFNGSPDPGQALPATPGIGWSSVDTSTTPPGIAGVRLRAAHVTAGSYDQYILVGSTKSDLTLHVAEINQTNGSLTEVASGALTGYPLQFDVGVVNGRIFIATAEGSSGLDVYEFIPASNQVVHVAGLTGTFYRALLRGPQPFPALFVHRSVSANPPESYIDIYDTKWFTQGGAPVLAKSLRHFGAPGVPYHGFGVEALVQQTGGIVTAYLYRQLGGTPVGSIHTDKVDISCIAADPLAPPIPYATMINRSSQARGDGINYFGDRWSIEDSSVSYQPVTELDWDFHNVGGVNGFVPELIQTGANLGGFTYDPAYWPCDLLNGGDLASGAGCYQSLGTPVATYQLGLNSKNINGPGAAPFISSPFPVVAPQLAIVGYNGNTLQVLAGNANNGDARGSQGNTADAAFAWTFTPAGTASGAVVTVPTTATAFNLTATYKGGYATSKSGTVSQVDLVPNFSLTPNPVVKSTSMTLTNLMQKASAAVVTGVTYSINGGTPVLLPSSFWATSPVPATVPAPGTAGSYTMTLTWNYTDHNGLPQAPQATLPFTAIDFTPVPALSVYRSSDHSGSPVFPVGSPLTWGLQQGTTYYLFDDENTQGIPHPGAAFYKSNDQLQSISSGDTPLSGSPTAGYGPATFAASAVCGSGCYFKIQVPAGTGNVRAFRYTVTGSGGCPPNCGGGTPTVSLLPTSPTAPKVGDVVTFTAAAQSFSGIVSYQWDFGDGAQCPPGSPTCGHAAVSAFVAGPNPNTHSYAAAGTYLVTVQASGGGVTKSASQSVVVAQGGPPSPFYTISGASLGSNSRYETLIGHTVTFTSLEPAATGTSWNWDFGDGATATGQVVSHAFTALGSPDVVLNVTNSVGSSSATIGLAILDPNVLYLGDRRYEVRAAWASTHQGTSGTGTAVNLTADTGYFWFFSPSNLEVVAKVLDACSVDGHVWAFAGGLTNLEVQLTVLDTQTGASKTYMNPEGTAFLPIQDTLFEVCPATTPGSVAAPAAAAVVAAPSVTLSAPTPANPLVGDTVSFTATPADFTGTVTYTWNFGDLACPPGNPHCSGGGTAAGPATNTHVYGQPGTYTVTVQASSGAQNATASPQTVVVSPVSTTPRPSVAYTIDGATLGTGGRWQTQINREITLTASETHGTWLWDFGNGETYATQAVTHTFSAGGNQTVTLTVTGDGTNTEGTSSVVIAFTVADPFTLYLVGGRFAVQANWTSSGQGTSGQGMATVLSSDTGYFWFFNPANTEVVVKVLDACAVDGHFWIFGSGLTNLGVTLTVTDLKTETTTTYTNTDGSPFQPIQDFATFLACN